MVNNIISTLIFSCIYDINKKKTGNKFAALHTSKKLSEIDRLKLELMKKDIEIERLKKGYIVKGDGPKRKYITINKKNLK